jgi:hypothetical protein
VIEQPLQANEGAKEAVGKEADLQRATKSIAEDEPKPSLAIIEEVKETGSEEEANPKHMNELRKQLFTQFPQTMDILNGDDSWSRLEVEELGGRCTFVKSDPLELQKFKEEKDVLVVQFEVMEETSGMILNEYKTEKVNGKVTLTIPWNKLPTIEALSDADADQNRYYAPILTAYANIVHYAKEYKIPNIQINGRFDDDWLYDLHPDTESAWQTNVKLLFLHSVKRWAFTEGSPIKEVLLVDVDPELFVFDPASAAAEEAEHEADKKPQSSEVTIEADLILPFEPAEDKPAEEVEELPALIEVDFPSLAPAVNKEQPHSEK